MLFILVAVTVHPVNSVAQHDTSPLAAFMFDETDRKIVTGSIDKDEAQELIKSYLPQLRRYFYKMGGITVSKENWAFPLANYSYITYRDGGNDFRLGEYDYFQGSNSKGHPAHDIMILDSNKDLLDDSTGKPVDVVSMSSGVVVAIDSSWKPGSTLRGGRYVKIYDVTNNGLFYYSHLSEVNVLPGMVLKAGDKIGEVGRTGRKAVMPQGKTHLHVAFLEFRDGYPLPVEIIDLIRSAEKRSSKRN